MHILDLKGWGTGDGMKDDYLEIHRYKRRGEYFQVKNKKEKAAMCRKKYTSTILTTQIHNCNMELNVHRTRENIFKMYIWLGSSI